MIKVFGVKDAATRGTESPVDYPAGRKSSERIVGLDGLRAVSIVLVLFGHGWATMPTSNDAALLAPYVANASLGVQTFFVISGFLITYLLRKEWERTGTIRLKAFYLRRTLRIFPALYAFLLVLTLLRMAGWIDTTYGDLAIAGTFLSNYKHLLPIATNEDYWFVGHFWTLALEEQFYLFWPATILAAGIRRAPGVAILIVVVAPFVRVVSYFLWPAIRPQLGMMLHSGADPIMVGCLAALWLGWSPVETIMRRLSAWCWLAAAVAFLFVVSPWLAVQFRGTYAMTVGVSLNSLAIAFIMLWVIRHPTSIPTRLLSMPLLCHVGLLSYSLYLWQQLFLTPKNPSWTGVFPINFLVCFFVAEVSYWAVEGPFLRLRDQLHRNPSAPVKVSQP